MRCVEGQNDALDAIRALQYEGTKSEIAQGFKTQGNEMVAQKMWSDAKEFYTKGLAVLNDKSEDKWEKPEDPDADAKLVRQLKEQIYANRALANLELSTSHSSSVFLATDNHQRTIAQLHLMALRYSNLIPITSKHTIAPPQRFLHWTKSMKQLMCAIEAFRSTLLTPLSKSSRRKYKQE